jgi:hypothetical protein
MKTTKFLLAGLLTGALAMGVGCKTDTAARGTEPSTPTQPNSGTGGTGMDVPQSIPPSDDMSLPQDNTDTREREPGVHPMPPINEPGTGGSGLPDDDGLERPDGLGTGDRVDDPMVPDSSDAPINGGMNNNGTGVPQQ